MWEQFDTTFVIIMYLKINHLTKTFTQMKNITYIKSTKVICPVALKQFEKRCFIENSIKITVVFILLFLAY